MSWKISHINRGTIPALCGDVPRIPEALKRPKKRWWIITNMVFEEDLTRDTLNRLIQRIDEELSLTDETEHEEY